MATPVRYFLTLICLLLPGFFCFPANYFFGLFLYFSMLSIVYAIFSFFLFLSETISLSPRALALLQQKFCFNSWWSSAQLITSFRPNQTLFLFLHPATSSWERRWTPGRCDWYSAQPCCRQPGVQSTRTRCLLASHQFFPYPARWTVGKFYYNLRELF